MAKSPPPAEDAPDTHSLGVAANLGLPLPPPERGRVVRLPKSRVELADSVAVATDLPDVRFVGMTATTRHSRLRVGLLIARGLAWSEGQHLQAQAVPLAAHSASGLHVLALTPTKKTQANTRLTATDGVPLPLQVRRQVGLAASGETVLVAFHVAQPDRALVFGAAVLSETLAEVWPNEL